MTVLEKHKAVGMYQDGVWAPRYVSINAAESGSEKESALAVVTVDIKKDMTEDKMMEILDYYTEYAALAYDTGMGLTASSMPSSTRTAPIMRSSA